MAAVVFFYILCFSGDGKQKMRLNVLPGEPHILKFKEGFRKKIPARDRQSGSNTD